MSGLARRTVLSGIAHAVERLGIGAIAGAVARGAGRRARGGRRRRDLTLRDFAPGLGSRPTRLLLPIACVALVSALGLAALRMEVIRLGFELGEALAQEQRLISEERELTVAMRQLRDPVRLAERARRLGFALPERLIDLDPGSERGAQPGDGAADGRLTLARARSRRPSGPGPRP